MTFGDEMAVLDNYVIQKLEGKLGDINARIEVIDIESIDTDRLDTPDIDAPDFKLPDLPDRQNWNLSYLRTLRDKIPFWRSEPDPVPESPWLPWYATS